MSGYAVIVEGAGDSFSAYCLDLPGCVAVGESVEEVQRLMRDGVALHVESLRAHGEPVPEPCTAATTVVKAPG